MIEIIGRLVGNRSVFLAGELVECQIIFTHNLDPKTTAKIKTKSKPVKLSWASAQIYCQCSVNENKLSSFQDIRGSGAQKENENGKLTRTRNSETSFVPFQGEKGSTVYSSKPIILFCDVTMLPGETQTFTYKEILPTNIPPSYRGPALKYSYKITIGSQKMNSPTKLLRIPFRVLVIPGIGNNVEEEEFRPTNPFYQLSVSNRTMLDDAMETLQLLTFRKMPGFFNITNSLGNVAEFCLLKQAFRIGDDIIGLCDFSKGNVKCAQFSVTLQTEEQILEGCQSKSKDLTTELENTLQNSPNEDDDNSLNERNRAIHTKNIIPSFVTSLNKHEEFCLFTDRTNISIPIPLTTTPSFNTDLVSVKWRLHFEFVTLTSLSSPFKKCSSNPQMNKSKMENLTSQQMKLNEQEIQNHNDIDFENIIISEIENSILEDENKNGLKNKNKQKVLKSETILIDKNNSDITKNFHVFPEIGHLEVETMVWDLPISVYATNPFFVSKVSMLNSQTSGTL